jgi:hypothetical protein
VVALQGQKKADLQTIANTLGVSNAYSQKIGHLFAERSATPGYPVDNSVIRVCIPL